MLLLPLALGAPDCEEARSGYVTLNEIDYSGDEWVELHNDGADDIDVSGWAIEAATQPEDWDAGRGDTLPAGTVLPAGGFLLLYEEGTATAGDLAVHLEMGDASTNADGVRLVCAGQVVDTVVYGELADDVWYQDGGAQATNIVGSIASGESLARTSDGGDTQVSGVDFVKDTTPTPGASNTTGGDTGGDTGVPPDGVVCTGWEDVKLNEVVYAGEEWIELHNRSGSVTADLSGWTIEGATQPEDYDDSRGGLLPPGTLLSPGGYLLIVEDGSKLTGDVGIPLGIGDASTNADGVRLRCGDQVVDTLVYGVLGDDVWFEDDGTQCLAAVPEVDSGSSLARVENGVDTDRAVDWSAGTPSPGEANPIIVCEPANGVRINEILPDADGADESQEWIELYNPGTATVRLDGYVLLAATSAEEGAWSGDEFVLPAETELLPGGFLLVGGSDVAGADVTWEDSYSLGNGTAGDAVRLVDCAGAPVDTALYGELMEDGLTDDVGASDVVAEVDEAVSIGRVEDGVDNNVVEDWMSYAAPTPGAPNAAEACDTATEDCKPDECTGLCCNDPASGGAPSGGCGAPPTSAWVLPFFFLFGARRWRR